jgi:signal transduction histidine kinase
LTIPSWSDSTTPLAAGSPPLAAGSPPATAERLEAAMAAERALHRWFDRPGGLSRGAQLALDLAAVGFALMILAQVGPPEFLFHAIFVVLVVHAFLFGLTDTLWRIGIVSVALIAYASAPVLGVPVQPMELTEWPLMFVIAVLVAWMADRRAAAARLYASLFRRASDRLLAVQEDERRRLARELHDGVGQTLTALTLTLDSVAAAPTPREAEARLASARRLGEDALLETHDVAERLRPARLERIGLAAAIRGLGERVDLPVRVRVGPGAGEAGLLDPGPAGEVYRIVQETLTNAARHSGAPEAHVELSADGGRLRVSVEDRGTGFDVAGARESGLGLAGMRERAALLGAELRIESAPGEGTRVVLEVPVSRSPGSGA